MEFLVDGEGRPYFLEANTRLQVEHPVTEMVVGLDLVQLQIRIAQGEPLPLEQDALAQRGHAIECRVYAEDPDAGFLPSPGRIAGLRTPSGPGIRDDSGVYEGWEVPLHYDPLLSKLVAFGDDRAQAIARLRRALREYKVLGIRTTLPFFERVLAHPDFLSGRYDTGLVARVLAEPAAPDAQLAEIAAVAAAVRAYEERRARRVVAAPAAGGSPWRRAGLREATGSGA
jgi:acetyl-CoA carboxylase biotin carboxylase subunit